MHENRLADELSVGGQSYDEPSADEISADEISAG